MRLSLDTDERDLCLGLRARLSCEADLDGMASRRVLAELGVFALEMPAGAGGLEMGLASGVIVCEEMGRRAAQDPYRASALLADVLTGQPELAGLMGKVATGDVLAVVAGWDAAASVRRSGGCIKLTGRCWSPDATDATHADYLLVPASDEHGRDGTDGSGVRVAAVAGDSTRVEVIPGRVAEIRLENAPVLALSALDGPVRARVRQAAYLLGLAVGALQLATARTGSRRQFGRPIGENQALSFPLARIFAQSEAVRLLLHRAAWLDDQRADARLAAVQALAYAAELALDTTAWAVHVHGAAGLTLQEPVHRYYRLAAGEAVRWGIPRALWQEAARRRQAPAGPAPAPAGPAPAPTGTAPWSAAT